MALQRFTLLEVLDTVKPLMLLTESGAAATTIYQALIDAELTAVVGAAPYGGDRDKVGAAQ
jgi:hypothetical protein